MKRELSTHAAAAKAIRSELRKNGIDGIVSAKSYSGGSSVDIRITDQLPGVVRQVEAFANQFQHGHFDGMTDSYCYSNRRDDLPQVQFVFVHAGYSDELRQSAWDYFRNWHAGYDLYPEGYVEAQELCHDVSQQVYRVLKGSQGSFWRTRKPKLVIPGVVA